MKKPKSIKKIKHKKLIMEGEVKWSPKMIQGLSFSKKKESAKSQNILKDNLNKLILKSIRLSISNNVQLNFLITILHTLPTLND